jgi:hypothetical protein
MVMVSVVSNAGAYLWCPLYLLRLVYIGNIFLMKTSMTATGHVLALATLGDVTQILSILFDAMLPKVAKASTLSVAVAGNIGLNFANENTALVSNGKKKHPGLKKIYEIDTLDTDSCFVWSYHGGSI